MSIVTLREPRVSHIVTLGSKNYEFRVGVPTTCSRELAELCERCTDRHGKVFDVKHEDPDADIPRMLGVQPEWGGWQQHSTP